ncbi:MAG: hypothetical protein ACOX8Q_01880 [Christensenellales bacterium]|jgi:bifunctional DNA-binding transcriptional regulator/antitoxin component of YhaV-PrlF toxin-antitoxin module
MKNLGESVKGRATSKGQIVFPVAMRKEYGNEYQFENADVEIYHPDAETFVIKALKPKCKICGTKENLLSVRGESICERCGRELLDKVLTKK